LAQHRKHNRIARRPSGSVIVLRETIMEIH
jgi:hypothetical protein